MRELTDISKNKKDTVAISNTYANAKKGSLSMMATQLYVWCISQIKKTDNEIITFTISYNSFKESFKSVNVKRDIEKVTDELFDYAIELKNNDGSYSKQRIMTSSAYCSKEKVATLQFNKDAWLYFTQLGNGDFVSGTLFIFSEIGGKYSLNIYLLLHQYLNNKNVPGEVTLDIDYFLERIGAARSKSYSSYGQVSSKILKDLKIRFDEVSPLKFDYEGANKKGKAFTSIRFFNIKKAKSQPSLINEKNPCVKVPNPNPISSFLDDETERKAKEVLEQNREKYYNMLGSGVKKDFEINHPRIDIMLLPMVINDLNNSLN